MEIIILCVIINRKIVSEKKINIFPVKIVIIFAVMLAVVIYPSNYTAALTDKPDEFSPYEPQDWHEPEVELSSSSLLKNILFVTGGLLVLGIAGLIAGSISTGEDSGAGEDSPASPDTGGYSGSW